MSSNKFSQLAQQVGRGVVLKEAMGLRALSTTVGKEFGRACLLLRDARTVACTGVGKSGHVARKLCATMCSLGRPALWLHPTEASHGDMGVLQNGDALLALSRSGTAAELVAVFNRANALDMPIVLITEDPASFLAENIRTGAVLSLPKVDEAWGHAPTTSTIMQMALGDALAVAVAEARGFTEEDFKAVHPGGALGRP